ncbi:Pectinesterase [Zea mays]|uniref:Pectinesterase n=1 Tax=Zea mays TaxID=4577 RepID=A0A1D6JFI6_MAIZE|nr:Pectinesterase [Zea mays]
MANRVTVASVIAAVGIVAVIGTMATVTSADDNDGNMLSSVKVSTVCAFTRYPEKCEQSLKHVVSDTSSPEDVFRDALNVALDEVSTAFQRSAHIGKDAQDKLSRNAMDVCKRVNWPGYHVIGQADAFIDGASWLQSTGTPNVMGFTKG